MSQLPASERRPLRMVPPYAVVLLLTSMAAVWLCSHAETVYHAAEPAGRFPRSVTRPVVFALAFNAVLAPALVLAWLGELVGAGVSVARHEPAFRVTTRLLLTLLPLVVLATGHLRFNPWLLELVLQLRHLMAG